MFGLFGNDDVPNTAPIPVDQLPAQEAEVVTQGPKMRKLWRNMMRHFRAGETDRLTKGWGTFPVASDTIIEKYQRPLVARSREQSANNDYARAFLRMCRQNIVGPQGVMLQAQAMTAGGKLDTMANDAIEAAWLSWGNKKNADVRGLRSMREIENSCVTSAAKDGEFFVRVIYGADAGPWGFSLQTLDAQRCPVDLHEKLRGGGFIRQGIEFNKYGRPVAYYFDSTDDTETEYRFGGRSFIRVVADDIIHGFLEDMTGQKRGLPWMATSLFRMRQLSEFEDASAVNARVGANKMGFIQWKDGFGPEYDQDSDEIIIESQAGEFPVLPEGAELKEWAPNYPAGEFIPFYKSMLRSMAAGMGVLYNNLASDLEGVNFSSIRQGTLDEREHWKELQQWLIESLIEPVFTRWLEYSLLAGKIKNTRGLPLKAEAIARYSAVSWQPRRWQWIDPSADVAAAEKSKNNMLTSPGRIIREQGLDPNTVWSEAARDVKAMIDAYVAQDIDEETAKNLVLISMGQKPTNPVGRPTQEKQNENQAT